MRRSGATRRIQERSDSPTTQMENGSSSFSDLAEAGQLTTNSKGKPYSPNKIQHSKDLQRNSIEGRSKQPKRYRRMGGKWTSSMAKIKRRLIVQFRRNPNMTTRILVMGSGAFIVVFWLSLFIMGVIQHRSTPTTLIDQSGRVLSGKNLSSSLPPAAPPTSSVSMAADTPKRNVARFELQERKSGPKFDIVFQSGIKGSTMLHGPGKLDLVRENEARFADFGHLEFRFLEEDGARRNIYYDPDQFKTEFRDHDKAPDDDVDAYYAFDDDYERGHDTAYNDQNVIDDDKTCRRVSEHRLNFQTCNSAHELNIIESNVKYISEGAYRQVMVIDHDFADASEPIIVKELHMDNDIALDMFEFVRMDANVAERLTSSPRTFDIYAFCGLTIISEFFPHGDLEDAAVPDGQGYLKSKDKKELLKPHNFFTAIEKLSVATQMAESIADLHGYPGGVIVHGDIQLSQFLYTKDKSKIKINDFNRAEYMLWDEENGEYCRYTNGRGHGNWRAPEEYKDEPLTEQLDVWSLGNNMYSLLTGLWVFYDEENDHKMQARVKRGETAYIDPQYRERSLAEAKLVEAIEKCFPYKPDDRATIFELASFLRQSLTTLTDMEEARVKDS